ncbi:OmpA family protein [Actinoplanes sp. NPDC024001]|uniref:OmpA family protein n=1 Tax=Actinoplanes sp. NPDC024001 TaxID=3154598 RepID=UPI0033CA49AE
MLLFPNAVSTLTAAQQQQIDDLVAKWYAGGDEPRVRVDGYASTPGEDALNWTLACARADAVAAELMHPASGAPGIPAASVTTFMHRETDEFGPEEQNRRVIIHVEPGRSGPAAASAGPVASPWWTNGPTVVRKQNVTPLGQYVTWVREVEQVYTDRGDVIRRLRRLYYSTFTAGPPKPMNPSGSLGPTFDWLIAGPDQMPPLTSPPVSLATLNGLFGTNAIRTPAGESLDPSHIFAALDVTVNGASGLGGVVEIGGSTPLTGVFTWTGDLSSWFVDWPAEKRKKPEDSDISVLLSIVNRKVSLDDLLSDMDAQIMVASETTTSYDVIPTVDGPPYVSIRNTLDRPPSEILQSYYGTPTGSGPKTPGSGPQRFARFVKAAVPRIPYVIPDPTKPLEIMLAPDAEEKIYDEIYDAAKVLLKSDELKQIRKDYSAISAGQGGQRDHRHHRWRRPKEAPAYGGPSRTGSTVVSAAGHSDNVRMFAALDDIDWNSLEHAYGPAGDVPGWIRGLTDPDSEIRETSLDALFGAVHHQGDVYESTLATVPFLVEALTTQGVPGRSGIADLLASIAESKPAQARITGDVSRLLDLAGDPDPDLRAAVPALLAALHPGVPGIAERLTGRLAEEPEARVRRALLEALGGMSLKPGSVGHLLGVAATAPASTAVAALSAVARIDPDQVPLDGIPELLDRAYAEVAPPAVPAGFTTKTLRGAVRLLREEAEAGRRAPHCARLIEGLTDPLGPRVDERITVLIPLLGSPHPDITGDALYAANKLVEGWRGDYREIVGRAAGLLRHDSPEIAGRAARFLNGWGPVAAPAADAAAERLADLAGHPGTDGLPVWAGDTVGLHPLLQMLAELGDERALPLLLASLRLPVLPVNTGFYLGRYPGHADRIVAEVIAGLDAREPAERDSLLVALRAFGPAAAPAVPLLLAEPLRQDSADALGRIGAAEALPALRAAAHRNEARTAVAAAGALWRIERSPEALPVLISHLGDAAAVDALAQLAAMGPAAAPAAPALAPLMKVSGNPWWTPARAALALWQITGDVKRTAPVLRKAWRGNVYTRTSIAAAARGPLAAALAPLLEGELAQRRRHNAAEDFSSSDQVHSDERLLDACRTALAAI